MDRGLCRKQRSACASMRDGVRTQLWVVQKGVASPAATVVPQSLHTVGDGRASALRLG